MEERRTVQKGYDEIAETYADERSRDGRGGQLAAEFAADLPDGSRILSAGIGSGGPVTAALAAGHDVVGMDLSREQLNLLDSQLPTVTPVQGDLTNLPFATGAFDGLVSSHAIIHVPRDRHNEVFAEFERVLEEGCEALLVVGNGAWEGRNSDWLDTGSEMYWSFYGREKNLELLRTAGFAVRDWWVVDDEMGGEWCFVRIEA